VSTLQITKESTLTKHQVKSFRKGISQHEEMVVQVRFDDQCGNGHNTFSITADVYDNRRRGRGPDAKFDRGGCLHEEIAQHFPEFAPFIKWHLCSTDGPHAYIANTVYFAGDRDCWGKREGEPAQWETAIQFGDNPIKHTFRRGQKFIQFLEQAAAHPGRERFDFEVIRVDHDRERETFGPKFTFGGFGERWHECPFDSEQDALDFLYALQHCNPQFVRTVTAYGKGKARELDSARRAAIWPDATDEQLTAEPEVLKAALLERLPGLLAEFRRDVESLGFTW
jgi:hypothetical protein